MRVITAHANGRTKVIQVWHGQKGEKGDKGDNYTLTSSDLQQIANDARPYIDGKIEEETTGSLARISALSSQKESEIEAKAIAEAGRVNAAGSQAISGVNAAKSDALSDINFAKSDISGYVNQAKSQADRAKAESDKATQSASNAIEAMISAQASADKAEAAKEYAEDFAEDVQEIRATLAGKADKSDTYTKSEVDIKVAEATPSDYDAVKLRLSDAEKALAEAERVNRDQNFRIKNLESLSDHTEYVEDSQNGEYSLPSVKTSKYAQVKALIGKSEQGSSEAQTKTENSVTSSTFDKVAKGEDGSVVSSFSVRGVSRKSKNLVSWEDVTSNGSSRSAVVKAGSYTLSTRVTTRVYLNVYDSNSNQIYGKWLETGTVVVPLTTPTDGMRFTFFNNDTPPFATDFMLVEGAYTSATMPPYEPYFEGIKTTGGSAKCVGKNLWNPADTQIRTIYGIAGRASQIFERIGDFTLSHDTALDGRIVYRLWNKSTSAWVGSSSIVVQSVNNITIAQNEVLLVWGSADLTVSQFNSILGNVQLEAGSVATEYEPYSADTFTMPTLPSARDAVSVWKDGKVYGNVGSYTFTGNENWGHSVNWGDGAYAVQASFLNATIPSGYDTKANISFELETTTPAIVATGKVGIALGDGRLFICTGATDVATLASSLIGKTIYYELRTPLAPVDYPMPSLKHPSTTIIADEVFSIDWETPASPSPKYPRNVTDVEGDVEVKSYASDGTEKDSITITPTVPLRSVGNVRDKLTFNDDGSSDLEQNIGTMIHTPTLNSGYSYGGLHFSDFTITGFDSSISEPALICDKLECIGMDGNTAWGRTTPCLVYKKAEVHMVRVYMEEPTRLTIYFNLATPLHTHFTVEETTAILKGKNPYLMIEKSGTIATDKGDLTIKFATEKETA